jgi:hypothetical protein
MQGRHEYRDTTWTVACLTADGKPEKVYVGQLGSRFSVSVGPGESVWLTTGRGDYLASILYKAASKAPGDELWSVVGRAEDNSPRRIHIALVGMRVSVEIDRGYPAWLDIGRAAELARAIKQASDRALPTSWSGP